MSTPNSSVQMHGKAGYYELYGRVLFKMVKLDNGGERLVQVSKQPTHTDTIDKLVHVMRVACCDPETRYRSYMDRHGEEA